MPANHKISVAWQIVFTFISILNLWAFYRIRKLRKYILYVIIPSITVWAAIYVYVIVNDDPITQTEVADPFPTPLRTDALTTTFVAIYATGIGFQALSIYLVIIWSRAHNRQFDQSVTQR